MADPEFLTIEEAAELTRRTPNALHVERARGQGVGALGIRVGRRLLFKREDIDAYIDELRATQLAEASR